MAFVRKRKNGSYQITVSGGYDSYGHQIRWYETYIPPKDKTEEQIKRELNKRVKTFERKCLLEQNTPAGRIKLADFIPIYLKSKKDVLSPTVYEKYKRILDICVKPMLGHKKLNDIKPNHIQEFVNQLKNREYRLDGKPGKISSATIKRYFTILQSVMHCAYKMELIGSNPAESHKIDLPPIDEPEVEIFTETELSDLLRAVSKEPLKYQVLIHLALNTSCRRGELLGLKWSDIDFETGVIKIYKSVYKLTGDSQVQTKSTKTGKTRCVMIPSYCIDLLKLYRTDQDHYKRSVGDYWKGDDWVFTQDNGKLMYPSTPTQWFSQFLKRHQLPHKKFHALRHTSATILLSNGVNIKNVSERLGHSQIKTTNRYVHAISAEEKQAASICENVFNKGAVTKEGSNIV